MTPVTRGEVEAAVEAYGLAVLRQKYPAQPTNPFEAHDHLRSLLTRLFAERDEAQAWRNAAVQALEGNLGLGAFLMIWGQPVWKDTNKETSFVIGTLADKERFQSAREAIHAALWRQIAPVTP